MAGVTLSTIAERITTVQRSIDEIRDDQKKFNDQALDRRVTKLEDTMTWIIRLLAAIVIGGIASALFAWVTANGGI